MDDEPSRPAGALAVLDQPDPGSLLLASALFDPDEDMTWRAFAACRGSGPNLYFHERTDRGNPVRQARQVCAECPVQVDCLDYALRHREAHGVWGGTTFRQRQRILRANRDQRGVA